MPQVLPTEYALIFIQRINEMVRMYRFNIDGAQSSQSSEDEPKRHPFQRRVDDIKPSKTDINSIIMDYLVNEGYPDAAAKFQMEANVCQHGDTDTIQQRVEIRNCILRGDIKGGLERINDLNPDLLDNDVSLHFQLLRLQLIEMIKACIQKGSAADITPAIEFATTRLAPIAPTHPSFLRDLEYTMALLIYPAENRSAPLTALLEPGLRQSVATRVNEALLESQGYARRARLKSLVRLRAWAEEEARQHANVSKGLPDDIELWPEDYQEADDEDSSMDVTEDNMMTSNGNFGYVAV